MHLVGADGLCGSAGGVCIWPAGRCSSNLLQPLCARRAGLTDVFSEARSDIFEGFPPAACYQTAAKGRSESDPTERVQMSGVYLCPAGCVCGDCAEDDIKSTAVQETEV